MNHGTLAERLVRGTRWVWLSEEYRAALPADLGETVMGLISKDRLHAKQGRSTARVRFDSPWGPLSVYLKRHFQLPWSSRLAALLNPAGRHTPASAEWAHLERARKLGVAVPDVVAAGERIGPWGALESFLMVAELVGCLPLNEAVPVLMSRVSRATFQRLKRELTIETAVITAKLHRAKIFHKDLYLCHFYLDPTLAAAPGRRLTLIDLHRLGEHRWTAARWRVKDLGQLLYSTFEIDGINDRDRARFWSKYRKELGLGASRMQARWIRAKAARYASHNRD
jgi:heptose I phosphotransferase